MSTSTHADEQSALLDQMIAAADAFYRAGWLWAHSGNMSCRLDDDTFVITATGAHLGELTPADFVEIDAGGDRIGDSDQCPSGDVDVHLALYDQLDDAGAVYHVHHLQAALCSDRDRKRGFTHLHDLRMIHALGIEGDEPEVNLPIIDEADVDTIDEALDAETKVPCLNVENHGLYVWGETTADTRRHVEALAYLFEYSWQRPMNPKTSASISGF